MLQLFSKKLCEEKPASDKCCFCKFHDFCANKTNDFIYVFLVKRSTTYGGFNLNLFHGLVKISKRIELSVERLFQKLENAFMIDVVYAAIFL